MEQTVNMSFTKLLKRAVLYKIGEIVSAYRWQTQVFVNVHLIIIHNTTVRYYLMSTTAACNIANEHRSFCRRVRQMASLCAVTSSSGSGLQVCNS